MQIINEGLSPMLYHFCPIYAMYSIAETDKFKLTSVEKRPTDKKLTSLPINKDENKEYSYYMCFSRTPSSLVGYQAMRRENTGGVLWSDCIVRMEINGQLLGSRYKGMPVNYFNDKNLRKINHYYREPNTPDFLDKNGMGYATKIDVNYIPKEGDKIKKKELQRYNSHRPDNISNKGRKREKVYIDYGTIDRNQMSEYEDRLFSNQEYIKNASRYIKRIDIYVKPSVIDKRSKNSDNILFCINGILEKFNNITHIYTSLVAFEGHNIRQHTNNRYQEIDKSLFSKINIDSQTLQEYELKKIIDYIVLIAYYPGKNYYNNIVDIINTINLPNKEQALKYANEFIQKYYQQDNSTLLLLKSKNLKKDLDTIPPHKYKQYITPLDYIRQRIEKQTGLSIYTFKAKLMKNYYTKNNI